MYGSANFDSDNAHRLENSDTKTLPSFLIDKESINQLRHNRMQTHHGVRKLVCKLLCLPSFIYVLVASGLVGGTTLI